jgi:hypothetical protein
VPLALVLTSGGSSAKPAAAATGTSGAAGQPAAASNGSNGSNGLPTNRRGVAGTIQSISGSTLNVAGRNGQVVKVITSASTKVTKVTSASVSDIGNGDVVLVVGANSGTNSVAADRISIMSTTGTGGNGPGGAGLRRPFAGGGATVGAVSSANNGTLTVTEADGTAVTVTTSGTTTVSKTVGSSVADLATSQSVVVRGTANADGSLNATQIQVGGAGLSPSGFGQGPRTGFGGAPAGQGSAQSNA